MSGGAHAQELERWRRAFLEEAPELASALEEGVLALETDPKNAEVVNEVFRAAHSLKGGAGTVGFKDIATLTHALETLLDAWRAGELEPGRAHIDLLLKSCDKLRCLLAVDPAAMAAPNASPDLGPLCDALVALAAPNAVAGAPAPTAAAEPAARDGGGERFHLRLAPKRTAFEFGANPLLVLREVQALSRSMTVTLDESAVPDLEALVPDASYLVWDLELELAVDSTLAQLKDAFGFLDPEDVAIQPADAPPISADSARPAGEPGAAPPVARSSAGDGGTIRVATSKIDKLVDLVGELVIAHSAERELLRHLSGDTAALRDAVAQTERHLRELQERVMAVRMVPVGNVFARLPRLVRELGARLGKEVHLDLDGADTELDKGMAEQLGDPLLHIVRNALDHGLELPDERRRAGKSPAGHLQVVARPKAGSVFIEVSDDGRGLDRERILAKARERGLVAADATLSDEQVYALVCAPGFSTAEAVTDLSGRGVGLDVVRRNVSALGGELTLASRPGQGATFTIRLPLTLTIMEGLLLGAGASVCVVPMVDVAFSLKLGPGQVRPLAGLGLVVDLPGETLPVLDLGALLGATEGPPLQAPEAVAAGAVDLAVVLQTGALRFALRVGALLGRTQVVVKSLETHFRRLPGILGATILGDGRVALILDSGGLAGVAGLTAEGSRPRPHTLESTPWN